MAGVSVQAFRRQGRRYGAGLVCSEMVSCAGLEHRNERTLGYLRVGSDEHPLAIQIFGADAEVMAEAARMVVAAGADVVQHENDADACEDWSQQVMRPGEVQRFQSGADDGVAKRFHRDAGLPGYLRSETSERPLKKQLVRGANHRRTIPCYFQFDSLARVCFLSVPDPRDVECTDFSGGAANGGQA